MKLRRCLLLIFICQLFTTIYCDTFFEKFCFKLRGPAYGSVYDAEGAYPTCTVLVISKNITRDKLTVCQSISPFEVLSISDHEKGLNCVLGQRYECFSKEDVPVNGKCYKVVNTAVCPASYQLAEIYQSSTAHWIGTFFKNYDNHLLISGKSTAVVDSFPYSRKEKHWNGYKFEAGKEKHLGIRAAAYKGSIPGLIEYLKNPSATKVCESTRKKKNTAIYYESICEMLSKTAGMKTAFKDGSCHFLTAQRFNYQTMEKTKGKYCEKIGGNVKSMLTPSNGQFELMQEFLKKKEASEQIVTLTPLMIAFHNNITEGSFEHILHVQDYEFDSKIYFERLFRDSRTFDETSAAFYWLTDSKEKKYMHLKPYVSAPIACSYGPTKYEFYHNDPTCPSKFLRFRGDNQQIRCLMITNTTDSWAGARQQCEGLKKNSFLAEFTSISEVGTARDSARWQKKNADSFWMGLRKVSQIPFAMMWSNMFKNHNLDPTKPMMRISNAVKILNDETFYYFNSDASLNGECFKTDMQKQGHWNSEKCDTKLHGFCSFSL